MFSIAVNSPSRLGSWKTMPNALAYRVLMRLRIEAVEFDGAAGGAQQRGKHFDGGGFSCSVWTKEGEDLACRDVKRDIVDGGKRAECLYKVLHPDHVGGLRGSR